MNLLFFKIIATLFLMLPMPLGTVPESRFVPSPRYSRFTALPIVLGIVPVSLLLPSESFCRVDLKILAGIDPLS